MKHFHVVSISCRGLEEAHREFDAATSYLDPDRYRVAITVPRWVGGLGLYVVEIRMLAESTPLEDEELEKARQDVFELQQAHQLSMPAEHLDNRVERHMPARRARRRGAKGG